MTVRFVTAARVITQAQAAPVSEACVEIDAGRVVAVDRQSAFGQRLRDAPAVERLDLGDRTVLPGLVDSHCHLSLAGDGRTLGDMATDSIERRRSCIAANALSHVRAGVTTLRDLGAGSDCPIPSGFGGEGYPRVLQAGTPLTTRNGHVWWMGGQCDGPHELRRRTLALIEGGADAVKIMASGGATEGTNPAVAAFTTEEMRIVVELAHSAGLPVAAHCHATESIRRAVDAGVDAVEHASFVAAPDSARDGIQGAQTARFTVGGLDIPDRLVAAIKDAGTILSMTLLGVESRANAEVLRLRAEGREPSGAMIAFARKHDLIAMLADRDLAPQLVISTDAGPVDKSFGAVSEPLRFAVNAGLAPSEVLQAITHNAARSCGMADRIGALTTGMRADMIAVDGNPLDDFVALDAVRVVLIEGVPLEPRAA